MVRAAAGTSVTDEEHRERRRFQNCEAQRRYRSKKHTSAVAATLSNGSCGTITSSSLVAHAPDLGNHASSYNASVEDLAEDITITVASQQLHSPSSSRGALQTEPLGRMTDEGIQQVSENCSTADTPMSYSNDHNHTSTTYTADRPGSSAFIYAEDSRQPGALTPVHIAAIRGHVGIMRLLLQRQPNCNERDSDGITPLFYACMGRHERIIDLLLEHGVPIDDKDEKGRTILHMAVLNGDEAMLKTFLERLPNDHAPIDSYDSDGRTALHIAVEMGFEAVGIRNIHLNSRLNSVAYARLDEILVSVAHTQLPSTSDFWSRYLYDISPRRNYLKYKHGRALDRYVGWLVDRKVVDFIDEETKSDDDKDYSPTDYPNHANRKNINS
ncbi:ankyrin repeat-containing domain protein [Xylaria arbuscula]|nr:ankyrin repeat-containing domain protein [Xylaria arbuscula]